MRIPAIEALGLRSTGVVLQLGRFARFAGEILLNVVRPPFRFRHLVDAIFDSGVKSLAVISLSGVTVGAVLGFLGYSTLSRFGAEGSLGALVGIGLVRELGPVLTALLVTGRAGSALAAEIASMVTTEQLDGLRMMSIDPMKFVVTPKALAMVIVMPLLSGLFIVFAMFGGYLIGVELLGVDGGTYLSSLESSLDFSPDVSLSLVKAICFGVLSGFIATYRGYTSEPTAEGVSAATTGTVVTASVAILICDFGVTMMWGV